MTAPAPRAPTTRVEPLRIWVHVLVGVTVGLISPFTVFAWPFALLVGMILGSADARRRRGEHGGGAESVAIGLIAAFGAIAMLFFGAIIGGVIAIVIVVLAIFSERAAAFASPTDRGVARIILFVIPILMWVVVFPLLGMNVDVRLGS